MHDKTNFTLKEDSKIKAIKNIMIIVSDIPKLLNIPTSTDM